MGPGFRCGNVHEAPRGARNRPRPSGPAGMPPLSARAVGRRAKPFSPSPTTAARRLPQLPWQPMRIPPPPRRPSRTHTHLPAPTSNLSETSPGTSNNGGDFACGITSCASSRSSHSLGSSNLFSQENHHFSIQNQHSSIENQHSSKYSPEIASNLSEIFREECCGGGDWVHTRVFESTIVSLQASAPTNSDSLVKP